MYEPLVSVIMCVYNTPEKYLREAIDSILQQNYKNLELIIVDDGSEEWCRAVLYSYNDKRVRLYKNDENIGLTASLNKSLLLARGKYIARMDADDICRKQRIVGQVTYMEKHEDTDVLACVAQIWDGGREKKFAGCYRTFEQERMKIRLSLANIEFTHPTVMFRKRFLEQYQLSYDEEYKKAQDYNMWVRCIEHGKLAVLQEPLFISRTYGSRIGNKNVGEQRAYADNTKLLCLKKLLPDYSARQGELYTHFRDTGMFGTVEENMALLKMLMESNDKKRIYDARIYREELFFWWFRKAFYKKNRVYRTSLMKNSYLRKNILHILGPQMMRYMADGLYKKGKKRSWRIELQWVDRKGTGRNGITQSN